MRSKRSAWGLMASQIPSGSSHIGLLRLLLMEAVEDDLVRRHGVRLARRIADDPFAHHVIDRNDLVAITTWVHEKASPEATYVDEARKALRDLLARFISALPRRSMSIADRVLTWYLNGSVRYLEDLFSTVPEYLADFEELVRRRLVPTADIGRFRTWDEFARTVEEGRRHAGETETAKIRREKERQRIDAETEYVYEDDRWLVVKPKTREASCFWGRGTRWCISATISDNMFDEYQESDGPIWIFIDKAGNERYAYLEGSGEVYDKNDYQIDDGEMPSDLASVMDKFQLNRPMTDLEYWHNSLYEAGYFDEWYRELLKAPNKVFLKYEIMGDWSVLSENGRSWTDIAAVHLASDLDYKTWKYVTGLDRIVYEVINYGIDSKYVRGCIRIEKYDCLKLMIDVLVAYNTPTINSDSYEIIYDIAELWASMHPRANSAISFVKTMMSVDDDDKRLINKHVIKNIINILGNALKARDYHEYDKFMKHIRYMIHDHSLMS